MNTETDKLPEWLMIRVMMARRAKKLGLTLKAYIELRKYEREREAMLKHGFFTRPTSTTHAPPLRLMDHERPGHYYGEIPEVVCVKHPKPPPKVTRAERKAEREAVAKHRRLCRQVVRAPRYRPTQTQE